MRLDLRHGEEEHGGPGRKMLTYSGASHFRQRIILSLLSGRAVRISDVRSLSANPGLQGKRAHTVSFISVVP